MAHASGLAAQPAHPLQSPYLVHADGNLVLPALSYLNQQAEAIGITTGGGKSLRFTEPDETADYERRAFISGLIATRDANWHDAFNALVWLKFPLSKQALNHAHMQARAEQTRSGDLASRQRSRIGDLLTQFDECGVVVVGDSERARNLWRGICHHQWVDVFVHQRAELMATTRFIVFGHGSLDALRAPFVGLCGKAIFIEADAATITAIDANDLTGVDQRLARRITSTNWAESTTSTESVSDPLRSGLGPLQPLPLLGIPGATTANADPDYYRDERQFRRRRA